MTAFNQADSILVIDELVVKLGQSGFMLVPMS